MSRRISETLATGDWMQKPRAVKEGETPGIFSSFAKWNKRYVFIKDGNTLCYGPQKGEAPSKSIPLSTWREIRALSDGQVKAADGPQRCAGWELVATDRVIKFVASSPAMRDRFVAGMNAYLRGEDPDKGGDSNEGARSPRNQSPSPSPDAERPVESMKIVVAGDEDVLPDWKEKKIALLVPINVPIKPFVERRMLQKCQWKSLDHVVAFSAHGTALDSITPNRANILPWDSTTSQHFDHQGGTTACWIWLASKFRDDDDDDDVDPLGVGTRTPSKSQQGSSSAQPKKLPDPDDL